MTETRGGGRRGYEVEHDKPPRRAIAPGKGSRTASLTSSGPSSQSPGKQTLTQHLAPPATPSPAPSIEARATEASAHDSSLDGLESELGPGAPVDGRVASQVSRAIGRDVSAARIHKGDVAAAKAAEHDASAFTVGTNIVMGSGAPSAGTPEGDALLAHELAHTAQQQDAAGDATARRKPIGHEDRTTETDADHAATGALSAAQGFGAQSADLMSTGLQLQRRPVTETSTRTSELAIFSEALPVQLGKRTYTVSGHVRAAGVFLHVELLGTKEGFEVPLTGVATTDASFRVEARTIDAGKSVLAVAFGAGKREQHYRVEIEPSQYEADADRPDRVRVIGGSSVLEKDIFPAGSKFKLSPANAEASTVVALPGSGKAKGTNANVVVEVAPRPRAAGVAVTLNLQK
ncbi:MAG TPA: DUF4157 domain-containing protein, partial [Kofleriaceae bacterium]|nr:DUF4157 domain-containing protein [Kofleriaceae bacterium]